ncbi:arginine--tRNA ligase, cytoplasmic-like [Rutidosis leptorrhynchoides]|uniref:arginine--tRNA ligase, cytoplasmic-like n=1 Tax=Rutidosis leptorrhynchoides TaxID=125765 RepID=UPI003A99CBA5
MNTEAKPDGLKTHSSSTMADDANEENSGSLKELLTKAFKESQSITIPDDPHIVPVIDKCSKKQFGDYQCNNVMSLWARLRGNNTEFKSPQDVGEAIGRNLPPCDMIDSHSVAGPGCFVSIRLSNQWIAKSIQKMLTDGIDTWAPKLAVKRVVVDFSSPNIAKEMHVGHLRSTIIGDTIARMLEYSKVDVLRRNHVGDWGTPFGMLIEFLFEKFPNGEASDQAIGELEVFYKASKKRFDKDPPFKERAQQAVVRFQGGEEKYRKPWSQICQISRNEFEKVYQRLGVHLEEKGESFYKPYIPGTLNLLKEKGLIEKSDDADVIFTEGKNRPLIVVKSDGAYNYASTDLAALWYRLNEEKAEWIIYVTDVGQKEHFDMIFSAAKYAGWVPTDGNTYPKISHVGFGHVLGADGKKFRTRLGGVVKLVDLLDEAKKRCTTALLKRGKAAEWTPEELERTAEAIGYGAVKYVDLKNNILTNYKFDYDHMLNDKGDTAVYLLYAHARICSIIRKSGKDIEELKMAGQLILEKDQERDLGLYLLQFPEVVEEACTTLLPNILCKYLYDLSEKFTSFYSVCQVVGSDEEASRLLLCEATAVVMRKCFHLLGITPVYKI